MELLSDPKVSNEWHIVASVKSVSEGVVLSAKVLGQSLVIWRHEGAIQVWLDLCIHRGSKLSLGQIKDGCLECPYHGWRYEESGRCVHIPAQPESMAISKKAKAFPVRSMERWGAVWVCFGDQPVEIPVVPELDAPTAKIQLSSHPIKAKGPRVVENYLDFSHLPFIHRGYLGDPDQPMVEDYKVERNADGLYAKNLRIFQPDPDGSGKPGIVSYDYYCYRPLIASFKKMQMRSVLTVTPVDEETSIAWLIGNNPGLDISDEEYTKWSDLIIGQDAVIVESQRPELLPLDLQEELHFYFDRLAIAYRRWLKELGWTYGTR
jgi:phenylpropionate dioxygenase-like ring-hydroxylating dioxygenase large terminal subunit